MRASLTTQESRCNIEGEIHPLEGGIYETKVNDLGFIPRVGSNVDSNTLSLCG